MYEALMRTEPAISDEVVVNLEKGAWEALAYVEEVSAASVDDLNEAVPDYYRFVDGVLDVRLVDQQSGGYGSSLKMGYGVLDGSTLALRKLGSRYAELTWQILYIDKNYLALDMGDIRVFFIHTLIKE